MSTALQVALFLASVAVVVFVSVLIPVFIGLRKYAARATHELEELKSDAKLLIRDSHTVVDNVNSLTSRAHRQLDEVDKVVRTVRTWTERADRIVEEVGDIVEAPLFRATRIISIVQRGLSSILDVLAKKDRQLTMKEPENPSPGGGT